MTRTIVEFSCVLCASATLLGGVYLLRARPRRGWFFPLAAAWVVLTLWLVAVSFSVRAPFAEMRMRQVLSLLCLALGPWLPVALTVGAPSVRAALARWRGVVVLGALCTVGSSAFMWVGGVDWITGIGDLPTTIITRGGLLALGIALIPAVAAAIVLGRRLAQDVGTMPAATVGNLGAMGSTMWLAGVGLWRGYVTSADLSTTAALAGASALVWAAGVLRQLPVARPLALSRGVVYAAVASSVVGSYLIAARVMYLAAAPVAKALPDLLPALLFTTAAGLVIVLGSQRMRYRLRGAIGRHFFRSKHDYGAVWVTLTRLVTEARDRADLAQRVAIYCRDLLCVDHVTVYLYDSSGTVWPAAFAGPVKNGRHMAPVERDGSEPGSPAVAGAATVFAGDHVQPIVADQLCPMRVHGHLLGYIAISSAPGAVQLDDEDRLVMDYITAQVASALELHRLGDAIGDAREVGSFHRLSAFIIHDLKNLVAQQSFVLENAQKFSSDPAFVSDALAAFSDSTNRMRALIARLRPGAPSGGQAGVTCDALALLHELTAVSRWPEQCRVRLAVPPDTTVCQVRVEPGALTQVLTNLLVNAVESLPPDRGEIDVRIVRDLADWCIEVRDNGCGISAAYMRDDLFRPFRSTKDAGLGIGLYHCKVVIEGAGGRIHVSSTPNVGTTVQIILPAASDVAAATVNVREGVVHGQSVAARR